MRPDDAIERVKAAPFRPFRTCLNSGRTFEIRHPKMVKVGRSTIDIFEYDSDQRDIYDKRQMVGLILIERIEPIQSQTAA
jgi:hypothetical protein